MNDGPGVLGIGGFQTIPPELLYPMEDDEVRPDDSFPVEAASDQPTGGHLEPVRSVRAKPGKRAAALTEPGTTTENMVPKPASPTPGKSTGGTPVPGVSGESAIVGPALEESGKAPTTRPITGTRKGPAAGPVFAKRGQSQTYNPLPGFAARRVPGQHSGAGPRPPSPKPVRSPLAMPVDDPMKRSLTPRDVLPPSPNLVRSRSRSRGAKAGLTIRSREVQVGFVSLGLSCLAIPLVDFANVPLGLSAAGLIVGMVSLVISRRRWSDYSQLAIAGVFISVMFITLFILVRVI